MHIYYHTMSLFVYEIIIIFTFVGNHYILEMAAQDHNSNVRLLHLDNPFPYHKQIHVEHIHQMIYR